MKKLMILSLMGAASLSANAFEASELYGTWCFYEQEAAGNTVEEKVTIKLNEDGTYKWSDTFWKQEGKWSLSENKLIMSDVGAHKLKSVTSDRIEMTRGSIMRLKKGSCKY
jgi:hypothetical protein